MTDALRRLARVGGWRLKRALNAVVGPIAVAVLRATRHGNPDRLADLGGAIMRRLGPWLPEHRVGRANLIAAFPEKSMEEIEEILGGAWDNLGRVGAEFAHLDRLWDVDPVHFTSRRIEVTPGSFERYLRLRDDGRPALLFTAHLANWELPAVGAAIHGIETAVLYRRPNVADIDRIIRKIRSVNMGLLIPNGLDAPVRLAEALARGMHVGLLVDQYHMQGVEVTFFGRRTRANPLIARLTRHIECPIHGVRMIRLAGHRFRADVTEAIEPVRDKQGKVDVAGTMQVITSIVEGWVREHPEQWLWQHRRWR
jgi:Kdo2-lipid IVA lauroyltransferase/acyltransferase